MKYLLFVYPCDETWDGDEMNTIIAEELSIITKTEIRCADIKLQLINFS